MRVIEKKMIEALNTGRNMQGVNTRVSHNINGAFVWLYDTLIFARLRVALDEMICEAEDVFQANSEHRLACVGIFSNGEAIYSDLDTERGRLKAAVA